MTLKTSLLLTLSMTALQTLIQYQDSIPEQYKHLTLFAQIALEALKGYRTHHFNTDGTAQKVGYVPPTLTKKEN